MRLAGRIAHAFIKSKLTPLFIVGALLLGVFATLETPREEDPQIVVPMLDVFVRMPGASPLAPFYPFSGLAPIYSSDQPVYMYTDNLGQLFSSIAGAISSDSSVAVMVTDSSGKWYVRPNQPGIVTFDLTFTIPGPVSVYRTGMWRVTGIAPSRRPWSRVRH